MGPEPARIREFRPRECQLARRVLELPAPSIPKHKYGTYHALLYRVWAKAKQKYVSLSCQLSASTMHIVLASSPRFACFRILFQQSCVLSSFIRGEQKPTPLRHLLFLEPPQRRSRNLIEYLGIPQIPQIGYLGCKPV